MADDDGRISLEFKFENNLLKLQSVASVNQVHKRFYRILRTLSVPLAHK